MKNLPKRRGGMFPLDREGEVWEMNDIAIVAMDGRVGRVIHRFSGPAGTVTLDFPEGYTQGFSPTQLKRNPE